MNTPQLPSYFHQHGSQVTSRHHSLKRPFLNLVTIVAFSCLLFISASPTQSAESDSKTIPIFILAGQSNASGRALWSDLNTTNEPSEAKVHYYYDTDTTGAFSGLRTSDGSFVPMEPASNGRFGPEIGLSRSLYELGETEQIIIKYSRGDTNLFQDWKPGAPDGHQLYATLIGFIKEATDQLDDEGISYRWGGFFWMQGESDASASMSYAANLRNLIASLRYDLDAPDLPVVIGRTGSNNTDRRERVRLAQIEVAEADHLAAWVDTDDLVRFDETHLDAESTMTLGQRMAEAWHSLISE